MQQPRADFDFLLLDKRHADYVAGKSNRITQLEDLFTFLGMVAFATVFGVLCVSVALAVLGDSLAAGELVLRNRAVVILFFGGGAIFLAYLAFWLFGRAILADRRLAREGQLIPGVATDIEMRRGTRGVTGLHVGYRFQTSDGKTLVGKTIVAFAPGSRPQTVPTQGTPLAVLWVDDELHKAL